MEKKESSSRPSGSIPLEQVAAPVPVFNLTVLVRPTGGSFSARIANLDVETVQASTPRDAISRICSAAKVLLRTQHETKQEIPWITEPTAKRDDENQFMVPVHL
ncbi:MAG: hypothetical protein Aurels2KO_27300 [Aureliella sp.]